METKSKVSESSKMRGDETHNYVRTHSGMFGLGRVRRRYQ